MSTDRSIVLDNPSGTRVIMAAPTFPREAPVASLYTHYKRGGVYLVLTDRALKCDSQDYDHMIVVYQDCETGLVYYRSHHEFFGVVRVKGEQLQRFTRLLDK
jgi:hypothetical protein